MPRILVDGRDIEAASGQSVIEAARAHGIDIPHFCWHPSLSVAGSCRVCIVEVEGRGLDIACNMPVAEGMQVSTDSPAVRARRKEMLQLTLLNHPVDCGICDKAGECTLQDYHYAHNGEPSVSVDAKVRATKFHQLSERIVLDNERCILCSRCVRFTHEVSRSHGLGIRHRGDSSLVRESEDGAFAADPYSDNVIDLCPVGALLSRASLYRARVWYLTATRSVCPGCARGCPVELWHRKPEWRLHALDSSENRAIVRVTPEAKAEGQWICNKGRDLAAVLERPRALQPMLRGSPVALDVAIDAARALVEATSRRIAFVSSWGSNEELASFRTALDDRFTIYVKRDRHAQPGEPVEDDLLIRADKNPNTAAATALFPVPDAEVVAEAFGEAADLVLAWGEGFDMACVPAEAKTILLDAYAHPQHERADVFIPLSIQTERSGHYTNFQGEVRAFDPCFPKAEQVADAEPLFAALAASARVFA
jgi:NADH-quinone oxidoreductase subunit G